MVPRNNVVFLILLLVFLIFVKTTDEELVSEDLQMLSSCICKSKSKDEVYNLTTLGNPKSRPDPLSFLNTRNQYEYLIKLCYPFKWRSVSRLYKRSVEAYPCTNASLCQYNIASNVPRFRAVTTQKIKNGMLRCTYNKTISKMQWIYKGMGGFYETGGMVLTLICDEKQDEPELKAQYDIVHTKGHPWKYVSVKHKCCCPNKCREAGGHSKHKGSKENVPLEVGGTAGGFVFIFIVLFIAYKVREHYYDRIPPEVKREANRRANYGTFLPKLIPYEEIEHEREIGRGGFGTVSKGRWRNADIAIKRLHEHVIEEDIKPFITETMWMSNLPHHNIVQFYGVCILRPNLCIITEYMEGGSVAHIIHREGRVLSWEKRMKWSIDAAKGMTYLHGQSPPILHRDLKSDNLLVDENGLVKISDFGAVKLLEPIYARHQHQEQNSKKNENNHAEANNSEEHASCDTLWAGTLRWAAPEVIRKKGEKKNIKYTPACDVHSFAMTVWELVSNRRPYYDLTWDHEVMEAIKNGIRPDFPDNTPQIVKNFISSCWNGDATARPAFCQIIHTSEAVKHQLDSGNRPGGTWPPFSPRPVSIATHR